MHSVVVTIKGHSTAHAVPVPAPRPRVVHDAPEVPPPAVQDSRREEARAKAKKRAASSLPPPKRAPPKHKRVNCIHFAGRKGGPLPDFKSTCKCPAPQLIEMQDYKLCMVDQCIGTWAYQQASRTRHGSYFVHAIMKLGSDVWLDFVQHFRVACWERLAVQNKPMLYFAAANEAKKYYLALHVGTTCVRDMYQHDPDDIAEVDSKQQKSIEELLGENAEALTIHDSPYLYTLLHEVSAMFPQNLAGDALMLHLAEQLEIQEVALLLDRPIADTVEWAHCEHQLLRSRAWP